MVIFRPSTGILAQTASATASLFSGVDSYNSSLPRWVTIRLLFFEPSINSWYLSVSRGTILARNTQDEVWCWLCQIQQILLYRYNWRSSWWFWGSALPYLQPWCTSGLVHSHLTSRLPDLFLQLELSPHSRWIIWLDFHDQCAYIYIWMH